MRGRKTNEESRSAEFRRSLFAWKQTPESLRPSLTALARELGTSHQLLTFYLKGLGKWQIKEHWRQAHAIRIRAFAEGLWMSECEEQQVLAHAGAAIRATVSPALR